MIIVKDVARTFVGSDYFKLGDGKARVSHSYIHGCNESSFFFDTPAALTQYVALVVCGLAVQAVLARLLLAFQRLAPAPGYVQGMSTLAAVVLLTFHGGGKAAALEEEGGDEATVGNGGRRSPQERRRPMPTPQV